MSTPIFQNISHPYIAEAIRRRISTSEWVEDCSICGWSSDATHINQEVVIPIDFLLLSIYLPDLSGA
jgi:response regulator of citrate/malate metabolism